MASSLVVGMGIGQLYKQVLTNLGNNVLTVDTDPNKGSNLTDIDQALMLDEFETVHICTPNFTHRSLAWKIAARKPKIVFIEKPGLETALDWQRLVHAFPETRFMMVKNNMWRSNITDLQKLANQAKTVNIQWIRKNCIPHPGSWFTTKELAFGGVSRDLMPHLLSLYVAMNPNWNKEKVSGQGAMAQWQLKDIDSTDYGVINYNGTYDVDDECHINFGNKWNLSANWRSMNSEDSSIEFVMQDNSVERFELGWCPEEAYSNMISDALTNINNNSYWRNQLAIDTWIHERVENL